jgi:hypothetical protein
MNAISSGDIQTVNSLLDRDVVNSQIIGFAALIIAWNKK